MRARRSSAEIGFAPPVSDSSFGAAAPRAKVPAARGEAATREPHLPARGDYLVLVLERSRTAENGRFGLVLLKPAAHLDAVGGLLRCVVEIHGSSFG